MITPAEIREKAEKQFFRLVTNQLQGNELFPLVIPANKKLEGTSFNHWRSSLQSLYEQSKAAKKESYTVEWKEKSVNGIRQQVPAKIYFQTLADYLTFTKKQQDYNRIFEAYPILVSVLPQLKDWAITNPAVLLKYAGQWADIARVLHYFVQHPPPHPFYIRELPIAVHSKFIETHTGILKTLLDLLLPDEWKNPVNNDFAGRYFLKKPAVLTQIRILDESLKPFLGYDECSLTVDDAAFLQWIPGKVFLIENQACFLSFPKVTNAVAIWGEGFKARLSRHIPWLAQTDLYCWFDLDTAGFEMLNMVRSHYPQAKSLLMDEQTFKAFSGFSVENISGRKNLEWLTEVEKILYHQLLQKHWRLEQERIPQQYILEQVEKAIQNLSGK